jgi:hypothetical protein
MEIINMSTQAVIPSQNSVAAMPVKYETLTFAVVVKLNEQGKISAVRHTSSEKEIAELESPDYETNFLADPKKERKDLETIAFKQPVRKPSVGTIDGFAELVPDADERLSIINKGIGSKFNQKIRTTLVELDSEGNLAFQPTDSVYDATALVQEETQRKVMSQEDKALKVLAGLPADKLAAILAQFAALQSGQ